MLTADCVRPISSAARPKLLCSATARKTWSSFRLTFTAQSFAAGRSGRGRKGSSMAGSNHHSFEGKWAIHPSQVDLINPVFSPAPDRIDWAREVMAALAAARAEGRGAIGVRGVLVDLVHEKRATEILKRVAMIEEAGRPAITDEEATP